MVLRTYMQKLRSMLDEEESLEELIEQEQAALIESALRAEQGYLLEIARQESEQLEVELPPPTDELEVCGGGGLFDFL